MAENARKLSRKLVFWQFNMLRIGMYVMLANQRNVD